MLESPASVISGITPLPLRYRFIGVFGLIVGLSLSACSRNEAPPSATFSDVEAFQAHDYASGITPAARPQNFLFIILDAFHAEHSSMLGYDRETTPHLDALAAEGVYFTAAYSQMSSTTSSTLSFMTGQHLSTPEYDNQGYFVWDGAYTMAEAFAASGFRTGAFSANPWIVARLRFDKGFDQFVHITPVDRKDKEIKYRRRRPGAEAELIEDAKSWIESTGDSNWFCYLHLMRPHTPYESPEEFQTRFVTDPHGDSSWEKASWDVVRAESGRATDADIQMLHDLYDGNIAYADSLVGELLAWLESVGERSDTLIVVASDHGEAFMQHDAMGHNSTVYEEMIHVPLVFNAPDSVGLTSRAVDVPVEMIDLFPTLVELFGLEARRPLHGKSLLGLLMGSKTWHKDVFFSRTQTANFVAVRKGDLKLIAKRRTFSFLDPIELYDIRTDPEERNNLLNEGLDIETHLELLEMYRTLFFRRAQESAAGRGPHERVPEMTAEEIDTLKSLGYLE